MLKNQFGHNRQNSQMMCVIWNLASVHLEIVLVSVQGRCTVAHNAPQSKKPFWTHLVVLLGEEAQVEAWFSLFRDSSNLDARQTHGLHGTYHMLRNQFGHTQWNCQMHLMELIDEVCHMESRFGPVGDSISFGARQVRGLCLVHHRLRNCCRSF